MASRNGRDSISPTVPPISTMTTSTPPDHFSHGRLDFVGDVRNHLDGFAEVIAAAFARNDLFVNAAGGQVVAPGERGVGETFVMAEIEVGFGAIVGDEYLAVPERADGAGVDVEIGIEFLERDLGRGFREDSRSTRLRFLS